MNAMTCCKLILEAPKATVEALSLALSELMADPAEAVALLESGGGSWRLEAYFSAPPEEGPLRALLESLGCAAPYSIAEVPERDWVAESQSALHPVRAGPFVIHGRHDRERLPRVRTAIEIDAGQAFGTAHHGSTRGCLIALERLAKCEEFDRVLDVGTGSGILAIAAARLWQARIVASDIDPVAVGIAERNFTLNQVGTRIRAITAGGLDHPAIRGSAPYDLVMANILARPLCRMAHGFAGLLRSGATALLSGLTSAQAAPVAAAYRAAGFTRVASLPPIHEGDWVTLVLSKTGR
ncbi:MAG: 50S ribosomal protein L11 methyltransferase [Alphaproteobacteria bacterium]|nr:MAG: 50S ribosomal protein L11 methyltransferase [Alphaproteobacteria bacterium]